MKSNRMVRERIRICGIKWLIWPVCDDEGMERVAGVIAKETESGLVIEKDCSARIINNVAKKTKCRQAERTSMDQAAHQYIISSSVK